MLRHLFEAGAAEAFQDDERPVDPRTVRIIGYGTTDPQTGGNRGHRLLRALRLSRVHDGGIALVYSGQRNRAHRDPKAASGETVFGAFYAPSNSNWVYSYGPFAANESVSGGDRKGRTFRAPANDNLPDLTVHAQRELWENAQGVAMPPAAEGATMVQPELLTINGLTAAALRLNRITDIFGEPTPGDVFAGSIAFANWVRLDAPQPLTA